MVTIRVMFCILFHLLRHGIRPGILQVQFSAIETRSDDDDDDDDDTLDSSVIAYMTAKYLNLEGFNPQKDCRHQNT